MIKISVYMGDIIVSQLRKKTIYITETVEDKDGNKFTIKKEEYEFYTQSFTLDKVAVNRRHLYKSGKYVYIHTLTTKNEELFTPYLLINCKFKYKTRNYLRALESFVVDVQRYLETHSSTAQVKPYIFKKDLGIYTPKITHKTKEKRYIKPENETRTSL